MGGLYVVENELFARAWCRQGGPFFCKFSLYPLPPGASIGTGTASKYNRLLGQNTKTAYGYKPVIPFGIKTKVHS